MNLRQIWMVAALAGITGTACVDVEDKQEPEKGMLPQESPPVEVSAAPSSGKSDVVALVRESAHPYANNLNQTFAIALEGQVPSCSRRARIHFASIRTEVGYDYLRVIGPTGVVQAYDGEFTNVWSNWITLDTTKNISVRLETDYSITYDGFRIDSVEVEATPICPAVVVRVCTVDQYDTNRSRATCECPRDATCVAESSVTLEHVIGGGIAGTVGGHRVVGDTAYNVTYRPSVPVNAVAIGQIDHARVQTIVRAIQDARLLERSDVNESSNWSETLAVKIGLTSRTFTRPQGTFPTSDAALIARVEDLFVCGTGGALTCGAGFTCEAGQCVAAAPACVCTEQYAPVCGTDGRTYGNACQAGCANIAVRHTGECGIAGDTCGVAMVASCTSGFKCRYGTSTWTAPFVGASGSCVAQTYCDAPADCVNLPHAAVPGAWACTANTCAWRAGTAWTTLTGWRFATAHPYANNSSVWKKLDAPTGATKLRLRVATRFELESGYDFLEIQSRNSAGSWVVTRRYTGTTAPALTDELVGREFWLRLATDVSITMYGFELTAEWAN